MKKMIAVLAVALAACNDVSAVDGRNPERRIEELEIRMAAMEAAWDGSHSHASTEDALDSLRTRVAVLEGSVFGAYGDGVVHGRVIIEGSGFTGAEVSIPGVGRATTDVDGKYRFSDVVAGTWDVRLTPPAGSDFATVNGTVDVSRSSPESQFDFHGIWVRTASIIGSVTVGGYGLSGATVSLYGMNESKQHTTAGAGQYAFTGLRAGGYEVRLTYDTTKYVFDVSAKKVDLATSETEVVSFDGKNR